MDSFILYSPFFTKHRYDTGDEKMKETIGKAMYESRMGKGKKNINDPNDPTGGMKGMPSFDDDDDMEI